ncbi:hypothetical protein JT723_11525 [Streptomyces bryophytorum]|uniref:Uncharacterized protein n=1 Tax=Actinacidiphila bryophytorum TaxID=1436133 RepID=A0A9W4E1N4_9ACTN|nr:hypothetical protein [Actinacidiphila bryophytorum]MBN6542812.1 hypothetical protein [Actinacidiphila bryophytorum]CAG7601275.1 conserved hypothetical protein [Actinacidiphila bryophytorum]
MIADSDTRWKWGALTARRIDPDARLDARLLRGRATPTPRQLAELGIPADSMAESTMAEILAETHDGTCDVLVVSCVGGTVQALLHGLSRAWQGRERRPVVVTGYVGVVYEKLADGLLLRAGADVVLANSADDARRFRDVYDGVGYRTGSIVETALPFLGGESYRADDSRPFTVTFAVQPSVPDGRADRLHLLRRAVGHARLHPTREVLVKLRSKPGEHTTHIEEQPYQKLVAALDPPANLRLVYGNMAEVLDRTDLLVTVSSTAALESLHRGIPTAVLTDLGIRETLGNHHFLGSGCYASWDELDDGRLPQASQEWTAAHGVAGSSPYAALRGRVSALLDMPELPALSPYYTLRTAPGYLPGILARHGLTPKGEPVAGFAPREAGPVRQAVRDFVRNSARTAYRQGVQRVAPTIRRWGQL